MGRNKESVAMQDLKNPILGCLKLVFSSIMKIIFTSPLVEVMDHMLRIIKQNKKIITN